MSFLLAEDDPHETLQVALAFIDACEGGDGSLTTTANGSNGTTYSSPTSTRSSSSGSFDSPVNQSSRTSSAGEDPRTKSAGDDDGKTKGVSFADAIAALVLASGAQQQQQYQRPQTAARSGTIKNSRDAVRRSRAKKKAEADFLREQVMQLEATLSELQCMRRAVNGPLQVCHQQIQTRSDSCGTSEEEYEARSSSRFVAIQPKATVSFWLETAITQAQESKKAQLLNTELKEAVNKHIKLAKSLEAMLSKKTSQFGLHLLRDEQKQFLHNSDVSLTQETSAVAELWQRVQQVYLELDSTLNHQSWTDIADSVVCSSQLRLDAVAGPVIELRMNAPLRCGFHQAAEILWQRVVEVSDVVQTPYYCMQRQRLTDTSCLKNYTMTLDGPSGVIELRGISYAEIFSGADRDSYTWASTILCTQSGEVFREKGWIAASRVNASSSSNNSAVNQSLLRGYHQMFSDSQLDAEITSSEMKRQRDFIFMTLGNRIRAFQQFMQDMLLHGSADFRMKAPLLLSEAAPCPCW